MMLEVAKRSSSEAVIDLSAHTTISPEVLEELRLRPEVMIQDELRQQGLLSEDSEETENPSF